MEFSHPCSSLFSTHSLSQTHTHAKHRLIIVTRWPSNRCCEQCGSQATPALLCLAPPPPLWSTQRDPETRSSCLFLSPAVSFLSLDTAHAKARLFVSTCILRHNNGALKHTHSWLDTVHCSLHTNALRRVRACQQAPVNLLEPSCECQILRSC